ncbi:MAG: 2'-5' RNA ligase family protein [Candidatus Cloacimonetes bacterium]|nr:2'-5' RNA ligase family protein [Candidatus Cloacimonadota bacterium]
MKCTFALLVNNEIHDFMRKKACEINAEIRNGFFASQFTPHISLKQPFHIDDIGKVEKYFDELTKSIKPFKIVVGPTYRWQNVIGLNVKENAELRNCHNKINKELRERFENTSALHDGDLYHFHATIALGGANEIMYRKIYEKIKDESVSFEYIANEIVMFYYDDENFSKLPFNTYKINQLAE